MEWDTNLSAELRLKRRAWRALFLLLLCFLLRSLAKAQVSGEAVYREAYTRETGERDPEAAIRLYKEAVDLARGQGLLAEKSRYRIGVCNETLGRRAEAMNAYQELLGTHPSTDVMQAATARLEILKTAASAEGAARPREGPVLSLQFLRRWTLSMAPGVSIPVGNDVLGGALHRSATLQGAGLYRLRPWLSAGLELGYAFGHSLDFPPPDVATDNGSPAYRIKVFQLTPLLEMGRDLHTPFGIMRPYGVLGFGFYNINEEAQFSSGHLQVTLSNSTNYAGFNAGGGVLFKLAPSFAVGPDVRYHHIFSQGENFHSLVTSFRFALLL
jgi:hypothetical protein